MATILKHPSHHHLTIQRTPVQRLCIGMGTILVMLGFIGLILPSFMGLHLSIGHNLIHFALAALAYWCGYSDTSVRSFNYCLGVGALLGFVGIMGFIIGEPGYPSVGRMAADQHLVRYIPNILELGTRDHFMYMVVGFFLVYSAYTWRKKFRSLGARIVRTQGRIHENEKIL